MTSTGPMRTRKLTALALLAAVATLTACDGPDPQAEADRQAMEARREVLAQMRIPPFAMPDQTGTVRTNDIFEGEHTLLSFGFTNCPTVCPIMHANIQRLTNKLEGTPVRFVTISVDPVHDTPERLTEYADKRGFDTDRWTWLAPDDWQTVRAIVNDGLGFEIYEDPSVTATLPDGTVINNIYHPSRLFLVGPEGDIIEMYPGDDANQLDAITASIRRILSGAA